MAESFIETERRRKLEREKNAEKDAAADRKRRAESRAAFESSGAARQNERAKKKETPKKDRGSPWQAQTMPKHPKTKKKPPTTIKGAKNKQKLLDSL